MGIDATNEIAEVPAPLLELLQSRKRAANNGSIAENISVTGMDGAPAGQRNYSIFRYSASLRSREVPRNEAEVLVLTKAKNCEPPLPEEEALQCLESAYSRYEPGTSRPCTELGNAERFVDQYGNIIRYLPGYISWFIWKESRWHEDKLGEINQFAKKVVRSIHQEALDSEDHDRRDALLKHARNSERSSALNNMISLAATNEGIALSADALDSHDHLLGVQNGTVDLRTGIFRKSDPVDYITKASKASYDKDADCPLWKRFTLAITGGDKEFPQFLQRCIGYMLMGGNPEQIILILYGTGANGKSTFLRIVQLLLGTYSRTVESSLFLVNRFNNSSGPREDIVRLQGARLIHTTEIGEGEVLNEDLVKRMTGDDTLAGRLPYGKSTIEFQPKFVPCMASNHKPIIRGDDHAIWRRITLIPFTQTFSGDKQDKNLFRKLERELSGILNWAIEGCLAWQEQGLQIPESVTRATFDYRDEMDLLAEWIEICCETGPECAEATAVLYMGYSTWCEENGVQRPLDNRTFGRKLAAKGFKRTKPCGKRGFAGIRVLNEHEKKLKIQGSLAPRSQPPTPTTTSPDIPPPLRFRGVS